MVNTTMIVVFVCIAGFCTVSCIIATLLFYFDFVKQRRESREEIAHLHAEVRVCRELLKRRAKDV
jgi:hypothetical protein